MLLLGTTLAATSQAKDLIDTALYEGLEWREIGPWRGGRVTAVTGVLSDDRTYYMGATGGGVWKTENAGNSWSNVSDGYFGVGTIGAIAVAESDENIVYVGTGEAPIRGVTTSHGDGMYKSTDAGKTWKHIGLTDAGQIARVIVHPSNPDLVYVAVQGQIWGPSEERGVYRSTNGGDSWEPVLQIDDETGATDLSMDPTNPRIMYASMWEHGRTPGSSNQAAQPVGFIKLRTGATAGRSWVAASLSSLVKQGSMYLPVVPIAFMRLSKPRSIKVVCGAATAMAKPGLCSITSESFGLALGITSI